MICYLGSWLVLRHSFVMTIFRYERKYMEELKTKADHENEEAKKAPATGETETVEKNVAIRRTSTASSEQDLDTFLLGDLEDSDEAPDDGDGSLEDDFDKIGNSDVEDEKQSSKATTNAGNEVSC
ncbi:hypothetical protein AtEden1_Chr1g0028181 [Arabidopsis thaliana]